MLYKTIRLLSCSLFLMFFLTGCAGLSSNQYSCEELDPWMDTIKVLQGGHDLNHLIPLRMAQLLSPAFNDDVFRPIFGKTYYQLSKNEKDDIYSMLNQCYPFAWVRFGISVPFETFERPSPNQQVWQAQIGRVNRDSYNNIIARREKMAQWREVQQKTIADLKEQARTVNTRSSIENNIRQDNVQNNGLNVCGPSPQSYKNYEYGDTLYSVEEPCHRRLSQVEQSYILGISDYLFNKCGYPSDLQSRAKVIDFLFSNGFAAVFGGQMGSSDLGETTKSQLSNSTGAIAGQQTAKLIGCTSHGKALADDIVKYIDRKQQVTPGKPSFVAGCVKYYSGRISKEQCQCVANIGSSVMPNIYDTSFSRETIYKIIERNPYSGAMITFKCGITRY